MKKLLFLVLGIFSLSAGAQTLDTLYANENHITALFFPSKVRQGIVGSQNFIFSYSQEKPQYFGLLKAVPGPSSNLLVLTQDGQVYSYVLSYKKELPGFNYFIKTEESIGKENPDRFISASDKDTLRAKAPGQEIDKGILMKRTDYYLKNSNGAIKSRRKGGLRLTVNDLVYFKDEVYLVLSLKNRSGITFEPGYVNVSISRGNRKRNASYQKVLLQPLYIHQFPKAILHGQEPKFVLVFSKFTLGAHEKLEVEVREKKGSRLVRMRFRP